MFKTKKDFKFSTLPTAPETEYTISPDDKIDFRIFTNDGFKLIDITSQVFTNIGVSTQFLVEVDGNVKLPIIGKVVLKDITVREAEKLLEEKYSEYYNKPFIMMKVVNRRVMVFPGSGGTGTVVTLENENTTLIEVLARAGGISSSGKAKRVKLIREGPQKTTEVLLIDLSTIEGATQARMPLQANDIVYIEPIRRITAGVLGEISPVLGIITSFLFVYSLFINK
jgi:polysaccharide biosynthesis/export protein